MLTIVLPKIELYDSKENLFINYDEQIIHLEHSLVAISKWESKFHKSFFLEGNRTTDEILFYIECMIIESESVLYLHERLTDEILSTIDEYMGDIMTATTFSSIKSKGRAEIVTSELVYYWMVSFGIPFECQYWHISRLMTLIQICCVKNSPSKKMSKKEQALMNSKINQMRRKKLNTTG